MKSSVITGFNNDRGNQEKDNTNGAEYPEEFS